MCFTDFIDWKYIHSWLVFSTQLVKCCPMDEGTILYLYTVAPLPSLVNVESRGGHRHLQIGGMLDIDLIPDLRSKGIKG
jgi:hypothetical protein